MHSSAPCAPCPACSRWRRCKRMRILLARHGETPWNAEGRYQGQEDIALSEVGIAQATALGERLREVRIDRAIASPLSRARRTAELALGDARASQLTLDDGFKEIGHGDWEGLLASEIRERDAERLQAWRDSPDTVQMPGAGGESLQQVLDRAWPRWHAPCATAAMTPRCWSSPTTQSTALLLPRAGHPLSRLWSFRQAPTTLNRSKPARRSIDVVRLNDWSATTPRFSARRCIGRFRSSCREWRRRRGPRPPVDGFRRHRQHIDAARPPRSRCRSVPRRRDVGSPDRSAAASSHRGAQATAGRVH